MEVDPSSPPATNACRESTALPANIIHHRGGWNAGPDYKVYFCGRFSAPPTTAALFSGPYTDPYWPNTTAARPTWLNSSTAVTGGPAGYDYAQRVGALFSFGNSTVVSKVGVSWISAAKACAFLDAEIPGWGVNATVAAAKKEWNEDVLSRIVVNDRSNETRLRMFYSGLYKAHLIPR